MESEKTNFIIKLSLEGSFFIAILVPRAGLEPARREARDFKSLVSTYFTIWAFLFLIELFTSFSTMKRIIHTFFTLHKSFSNFFLNLNSINFLQTIFSPVTRNLPLFFPLYKHTKTIFFSMHSFKLLLQILNFFLSIFIK